jgi:hypothetical protein
MADLESNVSLTRIAAITTTAAIINVSVFDQIKN